MTLYLLARVSSVLRPSLGDRGTLPLRLYVSSLGRPNATVTNRAIWRTDWQVVVNLGTDPRAIRPSAGADLADQANAGDVIYTEGMEGSEYEGPYQDTIWCVQDFVADDGVVFTDAFWKRHVRKSPVSPLRTRSWVALALEEPDRARQLLDRFPGSIQPLAAHLVDLCAHSSSETRLLGTLLTQGPSEAPRMPWFRRLLRSAWLPGPRRGGAPAPS